MADIFKTVLEISLAASVLALLALAARLVIGRRPNAILPLLSVMVMIRLLMPVTIPSPMSIMNLFGGARIEQPSIQLNAPENNTAVVQKPSEQTEASFPQNGYQQGETEPVTDVSDNYTSADNAVARNISAMEIASIVWIAGMAAIAGCIAVSNIRFSLMLKKNRRYNASGFGELLEVCRQELHIRQSIESVQLSGINTAAVYGILRPKLLISPSFGWLSEQEKKHVLLHELSHIKRCDMLVSLVISMLNTVYWFNPVIWVTLALAKRDMEIMCDMNVLKKSQDRRAYASTLLSLANASGISKPRFVTALLELGPQNVMRFGASVSTDSIKRRIRMISRYKKSPLFMAVAVILVIAIAVTGCTGAVAENIGNTNAEGTVTPEVQTAVFTVPEIEGQELIASYSLDYSSVAGDAARVANIKKTAEMLDGTVFPHKDDSLPANEDMKRDIDIPNVLGPITEEAGWQNASWTGWGAVDTYMYENDKTSGYFADKTAQGDARIQVGGGIEIAAIAYYRAAMLAGLDGGSGYTGGPEDMEEYLSGESKYSEPPQDNIDNGGLGAENNNYTNDLILKMWIENNSVIAAFYAKGTAEPAPIITIDPNDWRAKFPDKFTDGEVEKTDTSYKNANINISIQKVQKDNLAYVVADIYVSELKYFKTAFPKKADVMGEREYTDKVANEVNAILAINGDHCVDNPGPVVRNGMLYRDKKSSLDVLVMNYDGSMQTFSPDEFDVDKIKSEGAYQVWSFGPMLLKNGQATTEFNMPDAIGGANPRTAVGYYEPGHYCFVVVDGRQPGYSDGMTMNDLSKLMADLGCTAAYNMDGGRSAEMAFMGKLISHPMDGRRSTTDILYVGE